MMLPHPDTLKTVSDLQWNDRLRTAERERLAVLAGISTWPSDVFATVLVLGAHARAMLSAVAETAIVRLRRARPALLPEQI